MTEYMLEIQKAQLYVCINRCICTIYIPVI